MNDKKLKKPIFRKISHKNIGKPHGPNFVKQSDFHIKTGWPTMPRELLETARHPQSVVVASLSNDDDDAEDDAQ